MATPSHAFRLPALRRAFLRSSSTSNSQQPRPLQTTQALLLKRKSTTQQNPSFSSSSASSYSLLSVSFSLSSPRRTLHTSSPFSRRAPTVGHNNEPVPDQPPTTDFDRMDVLGSAPAPATAVTMCLDDGFALDSGVRITGGNGALLVGGEAFAWRPWDLEKEEGVVGGGGRGKKRLVNEKGQWDVGSEAFGLLGLVWPRPDLLILGVGPEMRPISPETRKAISALGMRVEVLDTRNAAAQFNLLATERGVEDVAAAMIPLGWKEGVGVVSS